MNLRKQTGYMDMQVLPAMIGAVLLYATTGMPGGPDFDLDKDLVKLCVFLLLATAVLLYGFAMHLYALGYPESPFNKHSSPLFMTLLCAGALGFVAYRFYRVELVIGALVYGVLALLVVGLGVGLRVYRQEKG